MMRGQAPKYFSLEPPLVYTIDNGVSFKIETAGDEAIKWLGMQCKR